MIKNIIFDMDGVLVDSENAIRTACVRMFKNRGINAAPEDFLPFTGMGENSFISGVANKYGLEYDLAMKAEAYKIYDDIAEEYIILFDGIKDLILTLKKLGCKIAVASAADEPKVMVNLRCLKLSPDDFDALVTGSDVTKHKPDPTVFLTAAGKIGANPAQSVVIEDAVAGCQAAKAAGMSCIGVMSTFDEATLKNAGADYTVKRTLDILPIIAANLE